AQGCRVAMLHEETDGGGEAGAERRRSPAAAPGPTGASSNEDRLAPDRDAVAGHSMPRGSGTPAVARAAARPAPGLALEIETPVRRYPRIDCPLPGDHQRENVLLALRAAEILAAAGA